MPVVYNCFQDDRALFVTSRVESVISTLSAELGNDVLVEVYPECTYEGWGIPTGIRIEGPSSLGILPPTLLRDPGSGFLLFSLPTDAAQCLRVAREAGQLIAGSFDSAGRLPLSDLSVSDSQLREIMISGLGATQLLDSAVASSFNAIGFPSDADSVHLTASEARKWLCFVANTVELKTVDRIFDLERAEALNLKEGQLIGLIHTGSGPFETLLEEIFAYEAAKECLNVGVFSESAVRRGIYGLAPDSSLGRRYLSCLNSAMNYALLNRYFCYLAVSSLLETSLGITSSIISDIIHCGVESRTGTQGEDLFSVYRGVQAVSHLPALIAGHRETISTLVGSADARDRIHVSHGTSWNLYSDRTFYERRPEYLRGVDPAQVQSACYYNTVPEIELSVPYSYNHARTVDFFCSSDPIAAICRLNPAANVQSPPMVLSQ